MISTSLKRLRKEKGLTQRELAEKCGLATGTIQQYESNKREPNRVQREKLCEALGVTPIELMTGSTGETGTRSYLEGFLSGHDIVTQGVEHAMMRTRMFGAFDELNLSGKSKAVEHVEMLAKIPEYRKDKEPTLNAAHDLGATEEQKTAADRIMEDDSECE